MHHNANRYRGETMQIVEEHGKNLIQMKFRRKMERNINAFALPIQIATTVGVGICMGPFAGATVGISAVASLITLYIRNKSVQNIGTHISKYIVGKNLGGKKTVTMLAYAPRDYYEEVFRKNIESYGLPTNPTALKVIRTIGNGLDKFFKTPSALG